MAEESGTLFVTVENRDHEPLPEAEVRLTPEGSKSSIALVPGASLDSFSSPPFDPGNYFLSVSTEGYLDETYPLTLRTGRNSRALVLGREGEPYYWAGGIKIYFEPVDDQLLLSARGADAEEAVNRSLDELGLERESAMAEAVVSSKSPFIIIQLPDAALEDAGGDLADQVSRRLEEQDVNAIFARVVKRGEAPVEGLTKDLFVRFREGVSRTRVGQLAEEHGLTVERQVLSSGNAYLLRSTAPVSYDILDTANELLEDPDVEIAEPEILAVLVTDQYTPSDPLYGIQNHLPLINADDAWERLQNYASDLHGGNADVCIAIFDPHGVAPNHPDLTGNLSDGSAKLVTSFDFFTYTAQTVGNLDGDHGTQSAGVATAVFDNQGTVGIGPNCHLISARVPNVATGREMADAFLWAAGIDNGSTQTGFPSFPSIPADIIGNSWGINNAALTTPLRDAFDRLTEEGRDGKGCVIVFSTGNLGYVQFSNVRTWAADDRTIAVGASINSNPTSPVNSDHADPNGNKNNIAVQVDTRALYSPYGPEMDIVAPSHTCRAPGNVHIDMTTTTVRVGQGALDGCAGAATCMDYDTTFGGTSHASPTISGTAALLLSVNPHLSWEEVRDILHRTAVRIDAGQANAIGQWVDNDGDGVAEFSQWYGYGRVDVDAAVAEALALYVAVLMAASETVN